MSECLFCDIIAGRSPASVVYRDEQCVAFMDTRPVTPGHVIVAPIKHTTALAQLSMEVGGAMFNIAQKLAAAIGRSGLKAEGINVFLADGRAAGQEVFHVHLHVMPRFLADGFGLVLPPGYGRHSTRVELDHEAAAIRQSIR